MIPPRRKKWTEAEEKTLIDKYGEMVADGSLAKMRTREKKFKPVACYVNSLHHLRDPVVYPWQWTWKDVSTKMGHSGEGNADGDFAAAMDGVDNEVMGLGFEYDAEEGELGQLREMETRFEQREMDRERERQRRENLQAELDKQWEKKLGEREKEREEREKDRDNLRRQRMSEWEAIEKENEEMERKRREEELIHEREREERMNCRRLEWKKRIDEMLNQHRAEMGQMQTRILHEQQNLTSQLLGIFSQWTAQPAGLSDHTSASNHYLSQMMQNLHHVNGIVHSDTRVEGDNQEDQFIVDG
ncbi:hypothetical protein SESBI_10448 [Sesbania bispinosa]|nr:hypothetical protein SESBI_10448 [Sesbania bispinosa]